MSLRQCLPSALLAVLATTSAVAASEDAETLFTRANAAYDSGSYAEAISKYQELEKSAHGGGWVSFNLGDAYWRLGQTGHAIAAFLRSARDLPRDGDVRANLAFARRATQDAIAPAEPAPLWRTLFFWHFGSSYTEVAAATVSLNVLFWFALTMRLYRRESEAWPWAAALSGILLVLTGGSLVWRTLLPTHIAVVTQPEIAVHSGTSRDTVVRFRLHEGTEASVLDRDNDWLRVELGDGKGGWVAATDVEVI